MPSPPHSAAHSKAPPEVQLRETLDALNGTQSALHLNANTQHAVGEQLKRVEFRLESVERALSHRSDTTSEHASKQQVAYVTDAIVELRRKTEELTKEMGLRRDQTDTKIDAMRGALMDAFNEAIGDLDARFGGLQHAFETANAHEEKTDAFRKDVLDRVGAALTSKPLMVVYAFLGFLALQRLGGSNDVIREFLARYLLGVPASSISSPSDYAGDGPMLQTPVPAMPVPSMLEPKATDLVPVAPSLPPFTPALVPIRRGRIDPKTGDEILDDGTNISKEPGRGD